MLVNAKAERLLDAMVTFELGRVLQESAAAEAKQGVCDACFSDEYPIPINPGEEVPQLSLFREVGLEDEDES